MNRQQLGKSPLQGVGSLPNRPSPYPSLPDPSVSGARPSSQSNRSFQTRNAKVPVNQRSQHHHQRRDPTANGSRNASGSRPPRDHQGSSFNPRQRPPRQSDSPQMYPTYFPPASMPTRTSPNWFPQYEDGRRTAATTPSHSHPSPASTSSGSTSSLRTPPDLLLNGNTMGNASLGWKTSPQYPGMAVNPWNGLALKRNIPPQHLVIDVIAQRKEVLQTLPKALDMSLPSPPHTPPSSPRIHKSSVLQSDRPSGSNLKVDPGSSSKTRDSSDDTSTETSKKRRKLDDEAKPANFPSTQADSSEQAGLKKARATSSTDEAKTKAEVSTESRPSLAKRKWLKQDFEQFAALYRTVGREKKHAGDKISQEVAAKMPSFVTPSATESAALEQLDAVLLYCYAFFLDDHAAGPTSCITNNWMSLFGLLRYVTNAVSKLDITPLVGLCRFIESCVLRRLHGHDQRLLKDRQLKALSESEEDQQEKLALIAKGWVKLAADLERSDKLLGISRNLLSMAALQHDYPQTWSAIQQNGELDSESSALQVDPSAWPACSSFSWPIDATTPISHLVCFGRTLLYEHAQSRQLSFSLTPIEKP